MPPHKPSGASARTIARRSAPRITAAPPPRDDDPFAKKTGRRLTHYTPEFLAEAKRRIENTKQSTTSIASDFGIDKSVLGRLVRHYGWVRPAGALRLRGLSPVMRLAMQADELAGAALPPLEKGRSASDASRVGIIETEATPTPTLPLAGGGGSETERGDGGRAPPLDTAAIARLEAAVLKELSTVETMRASLGAEPLRPADAERTARTLSVLTETLAKLRRLRLGSTPQADDHDTDSADIDDVRRDLARRIDAFVASRADGAGAGGAGDGADAPAL